uniref:ATP-dependent zinc metalloprotease FtsH n=1 Tax=Caulerpa lentillifera TaxID=148947 RepID=A0A7D4Z8U1_9CHLO|nr:ATP-dependent zinc metalloprotease FtsH [Caulerpa lentillifera]
MYSMVQKQKQIDKNQLKIFLILQDIYQIFGYFRQPFLKIGKKTAKQITTLPIFLSFLFMWLGILQISRETRNSCIIKNYPFLLANNNSIPQKFETFYFQLLDESYQYLEDWDRNLQQSDQGYNQNLCDPPVDENIEDENIEDENIEDENIESDEEESLENYKTQVIHNLIEYIKSGNTPFLFQDTLFINGTLHPNFVKKTYESFSEGFNRRSLEIDPQLWWKFFYHKTFSHSLRGNIFRKDPFRDEFKIQKINDQIPWKIEGFLKKNDQNDLDLLENIFGEIEISEEDFAYELEKKEKRNLIKKLIKKKYNQFQIKKSAKLFQIKNLSNKQAKLCMELIYTDPLNFLKDFHDFVFDDIFFQEVHSDFHYIFSSQKEFWFQKFFSIGSKNKCEQKIIHIKPKRKLSGYFFADIQTSDLLKLKFQIKTSSLIKITSNSPFISQNSQMTSTPTVNFHSKYQHHEQKIEEAQHFFESWEKVHKYSWSLLFFLSTGWFFANLFKNLYKKYAKEILESCIDFLERAGILEDVQWIKEELGMAKIDKGYRGIRYQGKQIRHLIGLNRKNIILQVSDMIWFLKTKKLKASFLGDRFFVGILNTFSFLFGFENQSPRLKTKPKGFLFTGPPGTGKTLLVQAIAGETGVPVVTQSGGLLQNPKQRGRGARTVQKLFRRAREIAPCIVFIDEVDGIGTRRQNMPMDIHGRFDFIEFLESDTLGNPPENKKFTIQRRPEFYDDNDYYWKEPEFTQTIQSPRIPIEVLQDAQSARSVLKEQLNILTQLLIEMDGIHPLDEILIIGATNRLDILDPALLRPGRFQQILTFCLPDYESRIDLFKLYAKSSKIGVQNVSWDFFSKQTHGLSSADIASIVFASELIAIEKKSPHTLETLERGQDLITSFPNDPYLFLRFQKSCIFFKKKIDWFFSKNFCFNFQNFCPIYQTFEASSFDPMVLFKAKQDVLLSYQSSGGRPLFPPCSIEIEISTLIRNCYYNIGKMIWFFCLPEINFIPSINLWDRPKNFRFLFLNQKLLEFDEFDQKLFPRKNIEKRFFSFFGGKAAESLFIFLPLNKIQNPKQIFSHPLNLICLNNQIEQSNFSLEDDIQTAQALLKLMIEKWYFYLERISLEKFHPILENVNSLEYQELETDQLINQCFFDEMVIEMDMRNQISNNEQKLSYQPWWIKKVVTRLNYQYFDSLKWSRLYLSDPQTSERNVEWVEPDEFYHTIPRIPGYCMTWDDFLENGRVAISNLLLLRSFNTAFTTLRQFCEFIDFLADYFLRVESLRENDLKSKIQTFFISIV